MSKPGSSTHVSHEGDSVVVAVYGELDIVTAPAVWDEIMGAMGENPHRLVIDLAETTAMDLTGLGVIVSAHSRYPDAVIIRSPSDRVRMILKISGLEPFLTVASGDDPSGPDDLSS